MTIPKHPGDFANACQLVGEMVDGLAGPDQIESAVLEGQVLDISFVERHTALNLATLHPLLGCLQQFRSNIEGGDAPISPDGSGQQSRETTGSRACLQSRGPGTDLQPIDDLLVHASVESVGADQV